MLKTNVLRVKPQKKVLIRGFISKWNSVAVTSDLFLHFLSSLNYQVFMKNYGLGCFLIWYLAASSPECF